jgi:GntR family transcriptional regulator/MocR family aminotransferase
MELSLLIEGRTNLAAQVYRELRQAILDGRVKAGDPLPSSRELAQRLSVARNTIVAVYERLMGEGYLESRSGSGTFVAHSLTRSVSARDLGSQAIPAQLSAFAQRLSPPAQIVPRRDLPFDFRPGVPELAQFPIDMWRKLASKELRKLNRSAAYYGNSAGLPALREAIVRTIRQTRAVTADLEDLIITNGSQQALDLVARILINPGDAVAIEEPCYPAAKAVFSAMGARLVPVPVDDDGIVPESLPQDARLVYVTPSHQFPLGVPLSLARRRALLNWAATKNATIIEDDYDSEFRYTGRPLDSLQGLDHHGTVAYLGTFSKVLFPGLRLGYLIAPDVLRPHLIAAKWITDRHTEAFEQFIMARFINEGHFARYLKRMQRIYADRHEALIKALNRHTPWLRPLPAVAGLHLTALMPADGPMVDDLITRAAATGVGLYSIASFHHRPPAHQGLMFGFGACPLQDIDEGIRRLGNVFRAMMREGTKAIA